jgi:anti-sigma regulatory factor (Ser/Thr protein kinase)
MLFSVPARPQSAAAARHRLSGTLRDWALPVDLDTAQLLLSEVVTNAIRHGTDPAARDAVITIELAETRAGLRVEVRDPDQGLLIGSRPVPRDGGQTDLTESGRGLEVVGALAAEWGVLNESCGSVFTSSWGSTVMPATAQERWRRSWAATERRQGCDPAASRLVWLICDVRQPAPQPAGCRRMNRAA